MKQKELKLKLRVYWYIVLGLLALLVVRLVFVQFIQSEKYQTQAKENRIRLVSIEAPRGEIFDRNGEILAKNKRVYNVSLTYIGMDNQEKVVQRLAEILGPSYPEITADYINSLIEKQRYRLFEPVTILRDANWQTVVRLEEHRQEIPGVEVEVEPLRDYPEGFLAGHVLGYVHPIYDTKELDRSYDRVNYKVGDLVGKDGLEKSYEKYLRGTDGARQVEVDVRGRPVRDLVTLEPKAGNNLMLTLDRDLQKVMEDSLQRTMKNLQPSNPKARVASCVLIDVKTGGILAMASSPGLNPNDFTRHMDSQTLNYYFPSGDYDPMNPGAASNRALRAQYPPGSTFKPITGMAVLESGRQTPEEKVNCPGAYWVKPNVRCTGVHGLVNLYQAMAVSCNTFFQEAGNRAGKDMLIKIAHEFGLGRKTGIDLPYESAGLLPTPMWKKDINETLINRKYDQQRARINEDYDRQLKEADSPETTRRLEKEKERALRQLESKRGIDLRIATAWQQYDTLFMSIGQGGNNYTVIQLANYVAAIANGGKLMRPYLVQKVTGSDGQIIKEINPEVVNRVDVKPETLMEIRQAMHAVAVPGGTGYLTFSGMPSEMAGGAKTGTAQTGRKGDNKDKDFHGVFVAFAPYDDPQVAFAGVVEYGRHGSTSAGLVARDVLEHYLGVRSHLQDSSNPAGPPSPDNDWAIE